MKTLNPGGGSLRDTGARAATWAAAGSRGDPVLRCLRAPPGLVAQEGPGRLFDS